MRTTVNIDDPILKELKEIQHKEGKPLGRLISDLLAYALGDLSSASRPSNPSVWISKPMGARIDIADRDAVYAAMDEKSTHPESPEEP